MSKLYKSFQTRDTDKKVLSNTYIAPLPAKKITANTQENSDNTIEDDREKENIKIRNQIIEEANREAEEIIHNAKNQAEELLENERNKIEDWWNKRREEDNLLVEEEKQKGYQAGYQEGYESAEKEIKEQYETIILNAQKNLQDSYEIKEQIIHESEEVIIELSTIIAEKIIKKEVELDSNILLDMTRKILRSIKETEKVSIFINPDYFSFMQNAKNELIKEMNGQVELLIFPDPAIENGGVVIKTSYGTLDAKIDTQLEEIKKILFDTLGRKSE